MSNLLAVLASVLLLADFHEPNDWVPAPEHAPREVEIGFHGHFSEIWLALRFAIENALIFNSGVNDEALRAQRKLSPCLIGESEFGKRRRPFRGHNTRSKWLGGGDDKRFYLERPVSADNSVVDNTADDLRGALARVFPEDCESECPQFSGGFPLLSQAGYRPTNNHPWSANSGGLLPDGVELIVCGADKLVVRLSNDKGGPHQDARQNKGHNRRPGADNVVVTVKDVEQPLKWLIFAGPIILLIGVGGMAYAIKNRDEGAGFFSLFPIAFGLGLIIGAIILPVH